MTTEHFVIIGNGIAANQAAEVLRNRQPETRITVISDEFQLFYKRHLVPDLIAGTIQPEALVIHPAAFYKERHIRLRLGQRVVKIDFDSRILYLQHMEKIHYTKLLICSGGKPQIPEIHYAYQQHFIQLKTVADAEEWQRRLPAASCVVIVGGDLIGVRVAIALVQNGKKVSFLMSGDCLWPMELTAELRQEIVQSLAAKGVEVIIGEQLAGIETSPEGLYTVSTKQGTRLSCDLVGAFFGLVPDVEFLSGSGLDIDRGILVNEFLQTSFPDVYAAGDCAQIYDPELRNYLVSIGWHNAQTLGDAAALNMVGEQKPAELPRQELISCDGVKAHVAWWKDL